MSKATRTIHAAQQGKLVKHEETFEDNLLPSSTEIRNLQQIRPDLVDFVKESAQAEQKVRHELRLQEMKAYNKVSTGDFIMNYTGLVFAFLLMAGFLYAAYNLILQGHTLLGSVFAGVDTLLAIGVFLKRNTK
jgi:uncharacterized membrane protein